MTSERIGIKQFDLANEKLISSKHLYVLLEENAITYAANYKSSHPIGDDPDDHSLGWEDLPIYFKIKVAKSAIVSIEIKWINKRSYWAVELEATGYPVTIRFYFETKPEADEFYKKIDAYIFG